MVQLKEPHKTCEGCKWENFPYCDGTVEDGVKMRIDNVSLNFRCGIRDKDEPDIMTSVSKLEKTTEDEIMDLKERITILEQEKTTSDIK